MNPYDFHTHSTCSDGALPPAQLVSRAAHNGVRMLALTDHDDTSGLREASETAVSLGIRFVNGVEISVNWRDRSLHIVGLDIDSEDEPLRAGLAAIRDGREVRAAKMAAALDKLGIADSLQGALAFAANPHTVGRTHFARFLVQQHVVKDMKSAFTRLLGKGRPGFVEERWPELEMAIGWIKHSGGLAVLAHPGSYAFDAKLMRALLAEFRDLGGRGMEVAGSGHDRRQCALYATEARHFGLAASCGSDFHSPQESRCDVGCMAELPAGCTPIWQELRAA